MCLDYFKVRVFFVSSATPNDAIIDSDYRSCQYKNDFSSICTYKGIKVIMPTTLITECMPRLQ